MPGREGNFLSGGKGFPPPSASPSPSDLRYVVPPMSADDATRRIGRLPRLGALRWPLLLAALVLLTLASHGPALDAGFVRFDDTAYVQGNRHVSTGLRPENVRWALTGYEQANWHPLTWISHMVDVELFGFEPRGHHAVNLALHVLNVIVLFLVLRSLTGDALPSLLVTSLFAVHPANVESVAWIAQRKTLLSSLFALLAIAAYARYARGGGRRFYAASLAGLALSLASKPMLVTFPFALLLLDYWPLRRAAFEPAPGSPVRLATLLRGLWRLLPEKLPFLALCAATSLVTLDAQQVAMSPLDILPVSARLENVAISYVQYIATYFAPVRLAVFYPLYPEEFTSRLVFGSAALLGVLTVALCWLGLRWRYLLVGWLWFLGTLIPVIGIVQVGMQSMADRYVYIPFWGLSIALVWSLRDLLGSRLRARPLRLATAVVMAGVLAWLGVRTHRQTQKWHDPITLFESALEATENNWLAHAFLAERYYAQSDFDRTIEHSLEAIKGNRDLGPIRSTYGLALNDIGKPELAREQFELAVQQDPDDPIGFMNLGWYHAERGHYDLALQVLGIAKDKINADTPGYTKKTIYANLASTLARTRQLGAARDEFARALELEPDEIALLRDAARVDLRLNEPTRAIERLEHALEVDPRDADSAFLLATAVMLQGGDSAPLFAHAQTLGPRQVAVTADLARTLADEGRSDTARALLDRILAMDPPPDEADVHFVASMVHTHLGEIALAQGDAARAVVELDQAVAIWPDNWDASSRLAFLLATSTDPALRNPARAVALAERSSAAKREFASLSTLAAAYAAAERLSAAVETAREGLELASEANDARGIATLQKQIDLYSQLQDPVSETAPQ